MTRSLETLLAIPLFVAACTSSDGVVDELAGETAEDVAQDGKSDGAVDGSYTYFAISSDLQACLGPVCGGYHLGRLNRTTTVCHDGTTSARCYVPELDWSESNLSAALRDVFVSHAGPASLSGGVRAIVRGRFGAQTYDGLGNLGRFIVTEAWVAQGGAVSDGVFVRAKDNGLRCITAPCPSIEEKALNTSRNANIDGIDWSAGDLLDHQIATLWDDMFGTAHGVIIAGDRYETEINNQTSRGRTAIAAYRRLADAPTTQCYVGGCSGEICSDQLDVVSACIWNPEFACYQDPDARCEQQPDGACGWTPTTELAACLANP